VVLARNVLCTGSTYAVGANHQGQLGMGDTMPREIFTVIPGLKGKGVDVVAAVRRLTIVLCASTLSNSSCM
jgi:hypothetical protein